MKVIDPADKVIQSVIFEKPEVVVKILRDSGVSVSNRPTLDEITEKTFVEVYDKQNKEFAKKFDINQNG